MNREEFLNYVSQVKWRFCKSVPNWPHFYIVEKELPDQSVYQAARAFVKDSGYVGKFFNMDVHYFDADGWTYWASPLDARFLEQLPVTVLDWNGDEDKELKNDAAKGMTLKDYTAAKARRPIHKVKISGSTMTFSDDGCDYTVEELARGDFDHDGCEDSLISISTYYRGGSGRYFQTFVVSKTDRKAHILRAVNGFPDKF